VTLHEFVTAVPNFAGLSATDKILHFGWYLHTPKNQERFDQKSIRSCFEAENMPTPNLSKEFTRLLDRKPKVLLKDGGGFRLEHQTRLNFDKKYGEHETTIVISQLLKDLPGKIADDAERLFLSEALRCYKAQAFRATTIMAWNLAYDHLLRWIIADPKRLGDFNSKIIARIGEKRGKVMAMVKREDFEELKETEVLDICGNAGILPSDNLKKILDMQLTKRNLAAHPSLVEIDRPTADDTIYSLVTNIVLKLT